MLKESGLVISVICLGKPFKQVPCVYASFLRNSSAACSIRIRSLSF